MKKQKNRRLSIRVKILFPVSLLIILICLTIGISAYRQIKSDLTAMGVEQAKMASTIAVRQIDGNVIASLVPGSEGSKNYNNILQKMRNIQSTYGIKFLYTLYTDGSKLYYGVDSDESENQRSIGDPFEFAYEEFASVFDGQPYLQDYIYSTIDGDLLSAYQPIKNDVGDIVGILGCDYDASTVVKHLDGAMKTILTISLICLLAALVVLYLIVGTIMRSLNKVNQKIYDLVHSEGDLTQKLDIHTGDEMELISNNVNTLLEHIRGIMLHISANSSQLNNSSKVVVKNLGNAEMNISDVSATMEEMSAAMEETNASLNQINEAVGQIYEAVGAISKRADDGRNSSDNIMENAAIIYEKAVSEQKTAKALAENMAASVNDKVEKSKAVEKISELTTDIINITSQTNLLSLNASIEAARAGEAGRGFAVVADEIGKLASNSADAAAEIRAVSTEVIQAVNELAKEAEAMIKFMDETAMDGYDKLLATSDSYQKDVGNMSQMMGEFASESGQLKASIDDIKNSIEAVNIAVEESTRGVTSVTETSVDLTARIGDIGKEADANMEIATQLNAEVNKFKLE